LDEAMSTEPTTSAPTVDPVAFRIDQARTVLARRIPERFADAVADHPAVAGWVRRYLADPGDAPSLVLTGPTGVGKTRQCWGLLRSVVEGRARAGYGLRWQITTHPELNDELRPKPNNSHAYALEPYLEAELLVLDDLGAGKQSDWTGDSLHRLVDRRWANRLVTVYSTNLTRKQLTEAVGDRVVSRLADAEHVAIKGSDRRWAGAA
jgi:DNA replication protein DnaC